VSIQAGYVVPCFSILRIYLNSTTKRIDSFVKILILYEHIKTVNPIEKYVPRSYAKCSHGDNNILMVDGTKLMRR